MKLLNLTAQVLGLLCITASLLAQTSIQGIVLDAEEKILPFANVVLYKTADSTMVKGEISKDDGSYEFLRIPAGEYWIAVSFVGMPTLDTEPFTLEANEQKALDPIKLQLSDNQLDEVVVTAQKPLIEVKPDKMVFNVEGSVNATGNNAMELLRKSPGVVVDNNENIMLMGKSGVIVYIDNKPSPLNASDLAEYLRTVQSEQIESIEIITNPSSKYDAEGNAGIINIKFKKDKSLGFNGNVNAGYSVGRRQRYNGGLNLNYRNKKFNTFGNFSMYDGANIEDVRFRREQFGGLFQQQSLIDNGWSGANLKIGADYFINKKSTIGIIVNGNVGSNSSFNDSRTEISNLATNELNSILIASNDDRGDRNNGNININYAYTGEDGTSLNIDADYGTYNREGNSYQPNFYYDPTGSNILEERIFEINTPSNIDIYTFKVDYEKNILGGKLGTGIKLALVETDNTFDFFNLVDGESSLDIDRSNRFKYSENVNAAYANYTNQGEKFGYQIGLRVEQTNSEGDLIAEKSSNDENVKRSYLDFFPSGGITYTPNQKNSFQLNYSRRIQRPDYSDLNPFEFRLDELTFQKGNPFLNPQYAHNIQLTHSYNYRFNTSLSFSQTNDLITRIVDVQNQNATFITWLNLAKQQNASLSFSAPISITKWYTVFTNLTGYWTNNQADFGDGKIVDLAATAMNIYQQHTFNLPKDIKLELSGWYNSRSIWEGSFIMNPMGALDVGVQKRIFNKKANIKVSYSDLFLTNQWSGESSFGELFMTVSGMNDSRRLKVNFSYQFGNDQVKRARRRSTGLEDESSRVGS